MRRGSKLEFAAASTLELFSEHTSAQTDEGRPTMSAERKSKWDEPAENGAAKAGPDAAAAGEYR